MKGQTALEYLITYGWAILVILVVLAVLWYYGIFTPSKWAGEHVTDGTAFKIVDRGLTSANLSLILGNIVGTSTNISAVSIAAGGDVSGGTVSQTLPVTVAAGATTPITLTGITTTITSGNLAKFTVKVTYSVIGGLTGKTDSLVFSIKVA